MPVHCDICFNIDNVVSSGPFFFFHQAKLKTPQAYSRNERCPRAIERAFIILSLPYLHHLQEELCVCVKEVRSTPAADAVSFFRFDWHLVVRFWTVSFWNDSQVLPVWTRRYAYGYENVINWMCSVPVEDHQDNQMKISGWSAVFSSQLPCSIHFWRNGSALTFIFYDSQES